MIVVIISNLCLDFVYIRNIWNVLAHLGTKNQKNQQDTSQQQKQVQDIVNITLTAAEVIMPMQEDISLYAPG